MVQNEIWRFNDINDVQSFQFEVYLLCVYNKKTFARNVSYFKNLQNNVAEKAFESILLSVLATIKKTVFRACNI